MAKQKHVRVTINITEEAKKAADAEAKKRDRSRSWVIDWIIRKFFADQDKPAPPSA